MSESDNRQEPTDKVPGGEVPGIDPTQPAGSAPPPATVPQTPPGQVPAPAGATTGSMAPKTGNAPGTPPANSATRAVAQKTTNRRRTAFVISAIVIVLAIVGGVLGIVLSSSSPSSSPTGSPRGSPPGSQSLPTTPLPTLVPAPPLIPGGVSPPKTINDTCSEDVTTSLAQWLYSLPNGKSTRTIVDFGTGCYEVNGQLWLRGFKNWVFEGGTIEQKTAMTGNIDTSFVPKEAPYCGSGQYGNTSGSPDGRVAITFFMEGGCDITFLDMQIVGPNILGERDGPKIQDTAITFAGTQRGLVDHISVRNPYGDYVDAQGLHEAPFGGGQFRATDITVENSTFSGAGREGIGIIIASRIVVEHNTFYSVAATVFDIEFDAFCKCGRQNDILIADNTIVGQNYAFLLAADTAAEVNRFRFTGNNLTDGAQFRIEIKPETPSMNIEIDHNTATGPARWPHRASITITNVTGALILDNTSPVYTWQQGDTAAGPFARISSGEVEGNKLTTVSSPYHQPGNLVITDGGTSCGNVSGTGASLDPPCPSTPTVDQPRGAAAPN